MIAVVAAGLAASAIDSDIGSGSSISFPTLSAVGDAPTPTLVVVLGMGVTIRPIAV